MGLPSRNRGHECSLPDDRLAEGMRWICHICGTRWRLTRPGRLSPKHETYVEAVQHPPGTWLPDFK